MAPQPPKMRNAADSLCTSMAEMRAVSRLNHSLESDMKTLILMMTLSIACQGADSIDLRDRPGTMLSKFETSIFSYEFEVVQSGDKFNTNRHAQFDIARLDP